MSAGADLPALVPRKLSPQMGRPRLEFLRGERGGAGSELMHAGIKLLGEKIAVGPRRERGKRDDVADMGLDRAPTQ